MRNYFKQSRIPFFIPLASILLLLGSCTEVDDTLGWNLLPDDQQMKFVVGEKIDIGMETYLTTYDSLVSSQLGMMMLGRRQSAFGTTTCGAVMQIVPSYFANDDFYGYKPNIDSLDLFLWISDIYGKNDVEQTFNIYELKEAPVYGTAYFSTYDAEANIDSEKPLFSFTMKNELSGTSVQKRLTILPAGKEYVKRLAELDPSVYEDTDEAFRKHFPGIYIAPDKNGPVDAALYYIYPLSQSYYEYTYINAYATSYESNGTTVKDTLTVSYSFDDDNTYLAYPNVSILTVKHDYTGSTIVNPSDITDPLEKADPSKIVSVLPMQGLFGVTPYIRFNDDFFKHLKSLLTDTDADGKATEYKTAMINSAVLYVPVIHRDLAPKDNAPSRVGMYYSFKGTYPYPITDYPYTDEANYSYTSAYGGYLNFTNNYYKMDISMMLRQWMSTIGGGDTPNSLPIWLGPAMYTASLYTPSEVILRGTDTSGTLPYEDKLRLELSYTLIKDNKEF